MLKAKRALGGATEASALDEADLDATLYATESDEEMASASDDADGSDVDSDEEALQYEAMVEEYVDAAYQGWLERKDARAAQKVEQRKRKRLAEDDGEGAPPPLLLCAPVVLCVRQPMARAPLLCPSADAFPHALHKNPIRSRQLPPVCSTLRGIRLQAARCWHSFTLAFPGAHARRARMTLYCVPCLQKRLLAARWTRRRWTRCQR